MLQGVRETPSSDLGGGVVTLPNFFALKPSQSPNSVNIKYGLGGTIEKRLGTTTMNSPAITTGTSGWASFDFGSGFSAGQPLRWHVVAAGTGIFASSNRGVVYGGSAYLVIATDRGTNYQYFERSKTFLIACSDTYNKVLYWAGSAGTFMLALAPGSAPPSKFAIDFAGFLLLMNDSAGTRRIVYADNTKITTDPWNNEFQVPSSFDDEITGASILYKSCYVFTRYKVFRISAVGGNPDFAVQEVKAWGAVPRTIKRVTFPDIGEVILCLGWDKKVRMFDGSEDKVISDVIELDNGLSTLNMNRIDTRSIGKSHAEFDNLEQVYKLYLAINTSNVLPTSPPETSHAWCLNVRTGAWYPYANQIFQTVVMAESASFRNLFGVDRLGRVHWIDSGNRDITTGVDEFYDSPFFHGRTPKTVSKSQNISLYFSVTSSGFLYYQDRVDFNSAFSDPRAIIDFTNTAGKVQMVKTIDIPLTQNVYEFRLSGSASTADPWRLVRQDLRATDFGEGEA